MAMPCWYWMTNHMTHNIYLGLGSNLGDSEQTILQSYKHIERLIGTIRRQSAFYRSEPWGYESPHQFVNTVILVETRLSPFAVLACTQYIEFVLGKRRQHATERSTIETTYHDRPIDIDILLYDDLHLSTPKLTIPHPLMHERPFVMEPLREMVFPKPVEQQANEGTETYTEAVGQEVEPLA